MLCVSANDLAKLIVEDYNNSRSKMHEFALGNTPDVVEKMASNDDDDIDETAGWYGIEMNYSFGNGAAIIGYIGYGDMSIHPIDEEQSDEDNIRELKNWITNYFAGLTDGQRAYFGYHGSTDANDIRVLVKEESAGNK